MGGNGCIEVFDATSAPFERGLNAAICFTHSIGPFGPG
jgi:hypothetical protein